MVRLASYSGKRQALSKADLRPAAVWSIDGGRGLQAAWLDGQAGSRAPLPSPLPLPGGGLGERSFVQPVIQALSRTVVAIAWTDASGPSPSVGLATFRLGGRGKSRLLASYRSAAGEEGALAKTTRGGLVLASIRQGEQESELILQAFSGADLRSTGRVRIPGANPNDPHLASLSSGRADLAVLYRDDSGIALAVLNLGQGEVISSQRLSEQPGAKGPALASDGGQRLVAAWAVTNPGSGEDVQVQIIDALTGVRSALHQPHARAEGDQRDPMVALSSRGWIRTAWRDNSPGATRISSGLSRLAGDGSWERGAQFTSAAGVRAEDPDVITTGDGAAILSWTEGLGIRQRVVLAAFPDRRFGTAGNQGSAVESGDGSPGGPRNRIVATLKQDVLIGTSAADVFVFPTRSHSLLNRYDTIINYEAADVIDDHHARTNVVVPPITRSAGQIRSLSPAQLNRVCQRRFGYGVFGAVGFTVRGEPGTWLAINDRREGFQANSDPIIHLAGYNVSRTSPITII